MISTSRTKFLTGKFLEKLSASEKEIHDLADRKGIKWDNDPKFMRFSKSLTGKTCLSKMTPKQRDKMRKALKGKGKIKTAG